MNELADLSQVILRETNCRTLFKSSLFFSPQGNPCSSASDKRLRSMQIKFRGGLLKAGTELNRALINAKAKKCEKGRIRPFPDPRVETFEFAITPRDNYHITGSNCVVTLLDTVYMCVRARERAQSVHFRSSPTSERRPHFLQGNQHVRNYAIK